MLAYFDKLVQHWGETLLQEIPHIIQALLVVAITLYAAGRFQRAVERISGLDHRRRELARLLGRLARIAVLVAGLLIVVSIFDQTRLLASFIASLGIVGLLVAFALQDITKNFAAGVLPYSAALRPRRPDQDRCQRGCRHRYFPARDGAAHHGGPRSPDPERRRFQQHDHQPDALPAAKALGRRNVADRCRFTGRARGA